MVELWYAPALHSRAAVWLLKVSLIVSLAVVAGAMGGRVALAAPSDPLEVTVDGRIVTYDPTTAQGQLNGAVASLQEVLNALAPGPVQANLVEREMTDGAVVVLPDVEAVVQDHFIRLTNLSQLLALEGNISIWISGGDAVSSWKICIIITWGSYDNPIVTVDHKSVDASNVVVELNNKPSNLTLLSEALGTLPMTATNVIVVSNGVTLTTPAAQAVVTGNHIDVTNLTQELAVHGRLSIWIEGTTWRICIIITWNSKAALSATVDARAVTNGGQAAEINGVKAEMEQVLAIEAGETITEDDLTIIAAPGVTITVPAAFAVIKGNKIAFHNLTDELASYGRLEIWIGHEPWRICIIIIWGSDANLSATTDGRPSTVEDPVVMVNGVLADVERVLAINGSDVVTDSSLEIATLTGVTITAPAAYAVMTGNRIAFHNLGQQLAEYGRISIWISGKGWRICIIIVWGSDSALFATVDGRPTTVEDPVALVDGAPSDVERVLAINGSEVVTDSNLEISTPDGTSLSVPEAQAVVTGNQIVISNLGQQLAQYGQLGVWIGGKNWRICIIIVWGSADTPTATVDGRDVIIIDSLAQLDGATIDFARALDIIGAAPMTSADLQVVAVDGVTLTAPGAYAVMRGSHVELHGLSEQLAQRLVINIWVTLGKVRICVTIEIDDDGVVTVSLNGRPVTSEGAVAVMAGTEVDPARLFAAREGQPPTTTTTIELVKNGVATPVPNAQAILVGEHITMTGPADVLQGVRVSIWIRYRDFSICIIISFERLVSPDGGVVVDVPPHQVHSGLDLSYLALSGPSKPLPAGAIGMRHFNLLAHSTAGPVHQLDVDYSIKATYTDAQLASLNIEENSLRLMALDAATNTWQPVSSVVDAPNNMVTGTLNHFSEFAVVGDPVAERKTFLPIIDR